jgi:hypothetical protein
MMTIAEAQDAMGSWDIHLEFNQDKPREIDIKTSLGSQEEVIAMLLTVVEKMTGVVSDDYVKLIDDNRRAAGKGSTDDGTATGSRLSKA